MFFLELILCLIVTVHTPPMGEGCGLRPLVLPPGGSERLRIRSAIYLAVYMFSTIMVSIIVNQLND